ncbi:MAG: transposase, partial [Bacillota bacterium]|nr:transposase [Bacillota bacterium]
MWPTAKNCRPLTGKKSTNAISRTRIDDRRNDYLPPSTPGFAPMFAYLGQEGYCVNAQLRCGKDHCQKGTPEFLQETFQYTRRITKLPLLVRLDSGNDSADNIRICEANQTDYLVKRNLRIESLETWLATAKEYGPGCIKREGKIVYMGSVMRRPKGFDKERHLVYRVVERNILANGQILLTPEIEVDTYWT